jgi:hypothetical protein
MGMRVRLNSSAEIPARRGSSVVLVSCRISLTHLKRSFGLVKGDICDEKEYLAFLRPYLDRGERI